jgi:hypothetical protein
MNTGRALVFNAAVIYGWRDYSLYQRFPYVCADLLSGYYLTVRGANAAIEAVPMGNGVGVFSSPSSSFEWTYEEVPPVMLQGSPTLYRTTAKGLVKGTKLLVAGAGSSMLYIVYQEGDADGGWGESLFTHGWSFIGSGPEMRKTNGVKKATQMWRRTFARPKDAHFHMPATVTTSTVWGLVATNYSSSGSHCVVNGDEKARHEPTQVNWGGSYNVNWDGDSACPNASTPLSSQTACEHALTEYELECGQYLASDGTVRTSDVVPDPEYVHSVLGGAKAKAKGCFICRQMVGSKWDAQWHWNTMSGVDCAPVCRTVAASTIANVLFEVRCSPTTEDGSNVASRPRDLWYQVDSLGLRQHRTNGQNVELGIGWHSVTFYNTHGEGGEGGWHGSEWSLWSTNTDEPRQVAGPFAMSMGQRHSTALFEITDVDACPPALIGDGVCQHACNLHSLSYDLGDCCEVPEGTDLDVVQARADQEGESPSSIGFSIGTGAERPYFPHELSARKRAIGTSNLVIAGLLVSQKRRRTAPCYRPMFNISCRTMSTDNTDPFGSDPVFVRSSSLYKPLKPGAGAYYNMSDPNEVNAGEYAPSGGFSLDTYTRLH